MHDLTLTLNFDLSVPEPSLGNGPWALIMSNTGSLVLISLIMKHTKTIINLNQCCISRKAFRPSLLMPVISTRNRRLIENSLLNWCNYCLLNQDCYPQKRYNILSTKWRGMTFMDSIKTIISNWPTTFHSLIQTQTQLGETRSQMNSF